MGKQSYRSRLVDNGRLDSGGNNPINRIGAGQRFDGRVDARLKLQLKNQSSGIVKNPPIKITDARQLLLSKSNATKSKVKDARQLLLNKRKQTLVKQELTSLSAAKSKNSNKIVRSDGINTLVTLKNNINRSAAAVSASNRDGRIREEKEEASASSLRRRNEILEVDRTRSSSSLQNQKYQPIRIKIDNTKHFDYEQSSTRPPRDNNYTSGSGSGPSNGYGNNEVSSYFTSNMSSRSSNNTSSMSNRYRDRGGGGGGAGDFHADNNRSNNYHHHGHESMDVDYNTSYQRPQQSNGSSSSSTSNGHKLFISNLHPRVTEDDVLELFSDIGPIKRARFLEKGLAEVVYVKLEHAKEAIYKYDKNELDGRPMKIELVNSNRPTSELVHEKKLNSSSSSSRRSKSPISSSSFSFRSDKQPLQQQQQPETTYVNGTKTFNNTVTSIPTTAKDSLSNRFKSILPNKEASANMHLHELKKSDFTSKINVDTSIIQQVLFNKNKSSNARPVTFTVKL
jgi:hypothetical protein